MTNSLQKKLYENGYLIVKNVLNFNRDLKPILNDMEFVMECLIQKYAKKREIKKILNLDFKKKYSYISKLKSIINGVVYVARSVEAGGRARRGLRVAAVAGGRRGWRILEQLRGACIERGGFGGDFRVAWVRWATKWGPMGSHQVDRRPKPRTISIRAGSRATQGHSGGFEFAVVPARSRPHEAAARERPCPPAFRQSS